jgi:hypothetical protein
MASLLDVVVDADKEPTDELVKPTEEATLEQEPVQPEETEVPVKYRNKSAAELVRMHQEAEKALGRKGSEVGELRKVVDNYIQSQQTEKQAPQPAAEEQTDWFDDPDKALEQRINNHPKMKALEESNLQSHRANSLATLKAKHSDFQEVLSDNAFAEWVMKSKIRTQLFLAADQKYDVDAADELISNWKERTSLAARTTEADKESRKGAVKDASNGGAQGSQTPTRKKKYRRADIIKLMNTDRERYESMSEDILLAYSEGRVI